jgi:hypothetical protein
MTKSHPDVLLDRRRDAARRLGMSQGQLLKWEKQGIIRRVQVPEFVLCVTTPRKSLRSPSAGLTTQKAITPPRTDESQAARRADTGSKASRGGATA